MYIIQSGAVEVSSRRDGHKVVLTILEKEDFFGEMALLDRSPRSGTVATISRSRLLSLSRRVFLEKVAYNPDIDGNAKLRRLMITVDRTSGNPAPSCRHETGGDRYESEI